MGTPALDRLGDAFSEFGDAFVHQVPHLLAALVGIVLTVLVARAVRRGVEGALSLGGVDLAVLIGSLGLATVALGFALQDIVSNFTAGIVLLLEHPFTEGDQIAIAEAEGDVEQIRVRATRLRAPDGQLVIVPNKLLFTQVLTNSTAAVRRRVEVRLEVPYRQGAARAGELVLAAASEAEGVCDDPAPRLLTQDLGQEARRLRLVFWVDSRGHDPQLVRSRLLEDAERRLRDAGITLAPSR